MDCLVHRSLDSLHRLCGVVGIHARMVAGVRDRGVYPGVHRRLMVT